MVQKRVVSVDAIRGFAIFGILIVNMVSFHSPVLYRDPSILWPTGLEHITYAIIDILFQSSFYPLFALLFGYSLILFSEGIRARQLNFKIIAGRRFVFLLAVGLLHAFFIWYGDILAAYALFGWLAVLFLPLPPRMLSRFSVFLYLAGHSLFIFFMVWSELFQPESISVHDDLAGALASTHFYSQGTYMEITRQRIADWFYENNFSAVILELMTIFPLMLAGVAMGKLRLLERKFYLNGCWKKRMIAVLIAGLAIKFLPFFFADSRAVAFLQDAAGGPLLGISYAYWLVILLENKKTARFIRIFSYIGKISLTNYLMQSIIWTFVFYHYGIGLYGKVSLSEGTLLAVGFFAVQAAFSFFWVTRYQYGPIEWLWRSFTYFRFQGFKKSKN